MRGTFLGRRVGYLGEMRRSKRHLDTWIDSLADAEVLPRDAEAVEVFVNELRTVPVPGPSLDSDLAGVLATEARSVAESVPSRVTAGRTIRPLSWKWRRRTMITTFLSTVFGKLAIAAAAFAVAGGGLAVSDNLPDPAQEWVSNVAEEIGIDIPAPSDIELPAQVIDRQAPELPDEASDVADAVVGTIFDGDPLEGSEYGQDIADAAKDAAGVTDNTGVADEYTGGVDDPAGIPDEYTEPGSIADEYIGGADQGEGARP